VTALSDGTVVAVGFQFSSTTGTTPLILQNATSAPKKATGTAPLAPTMLVPLDKAPATPTETTTAAHSRPATAPRDTAVDRLFAALGKAHHPALFSAHRSAAHDAAVVDDPDGSLTDR
jgi:hypothetical protein